MRQTNWDTCGKRRRRLRARRLKTAPTLDQDHPVERSGWGSIDVAPVGSGGTRPVRCGRGRLTVSRLHKPAISAYPTAASTAKRRVGAVGEIGASFAALRAHNILLSSRSSCKLDSEVALLLTALESTEWDHAEKVCVV